MAVEMNTTAARCLLYVYCLLWPSIQNKQINAKYIVLQSRHMHSNWIFMLLFLDCSCSNFRSIFFCRLTAVFSESISWFFRTLQVWSVPQQAQLDVTPGRLMACSVPSWKPWKTARLHCVRCCRRRRRRRGAEGPWAWTIRRSSPFAPRTSGRGAMPTLSMWSRRTGGSEIKT